MSLINHDNKCFHYATNIALNCHNIKNNPERLTNFKPFIDQHNWKEINFPANKTHWKKFESSNKSIALNILYVPYNTERKRHGYKSKHNLTHENHEIVLITTDGKKCHYLTVKKISALLCKMTSTHNDELLCWNCPHSYSTKNKVENHKRVFKNHDYWYIENNKEIFKYIER